MCCVRIELVTPGLSEGATFTTVNQPQTLPAGVAEPTDPASRLIADVLLDDGFSLMLGAMELSQR